uniref:Uncharacterized protein n=1 Tax=Cacopsylla melanoneura TaxID=428564 RepID=A0A8D8X405_9HEMI
MYTILALIELSFHKKYCVPLIFITLEIGFAQRSRKSKKIQEKYCSFFMIEICLISSRRFFLKEIRSEGPKLFSFLFSFPDEGNKLDTFAYDNRWDTVVIGVLE